MRHESIVKILLRHIHNIKNQIVAWLRRTKLHKTNPIRSICRTKDRQSRRQRFVSHLSLYPIGATVVNFSEVSMLKKFKHCGVSIDSMKDISTVNNVVVVDSCPSFIIGKSFRSSSKTIRKISEKEISLMISI